MMSIARILKSDLKSYVPSGKRVLLLKTVVVNHSFHMVFFIRLGMFTRQIPVLGNPLGVLIEYFIRIVFSSDISCKAKIGGGLHLVHGHDIVIGKDVYIGERCKIFNGVTLGNKNTETGFNLQPKIGDDVVLSTGCKILGKITIGSNSIIGANSVVLIDIPENSIAVGVPAKIK